MKKLSIFLCLFTLTGTVFADEKTKLETIQKIIKANGLEEIYQEQSDQSKKSADKIGSDVYKKILSDNNISYRKSNPKIEKIFKDFVNKSAEIYSPKEITNYFTNSYAKHLSESEANVILAYYESEIGKKDLFAAKTANIELITHITNETNTHFNQLLQKLISDLNKAIKK